MCVAYGATYTPTHTPSPKAYHAELLFKSWNECKVKQIYSHRQGISYTVRYQANGHYNVLSMQSKYMYRKRFENLQFNRSNKVNTALKQRDRYWCKSRRIPFLRHDGRFLRLSDKYYRNQRGILSSFSDNKRKLYVLNLSVYKFSIPWFIQTSKAWKKRNLAVESGDSSQDTPTSSSSNPITPTISLPAMEKNLPTVGSYGPYNFDIPTDLLPYVPPGHLYVNKKAKRSKIIPPGSPEWIDKIKVIQQEYETYYELLKIAEDQKAKFLGTSSKHLHKRKGLVSDLTKYTDTFDRKFTSLLNRRACCTKQKAIMQANEDFKTFQPDYFEVCDASAPQYEDKGGRLKPCSIM
uniref:DUF8211 domain-containing protein n=1 Tax=Rhizophagus irregularis (strain DAOM 181602 / DAOM 197198 / MUCL 43194) TaxID=747089 RepID=U9UE82_RHIID